MSSGIFILCIANACGMRANRNTFRSGLHIEILIIEQLFIVQLAIYNFLFIYGLSYDMTSNQLCEHIPPNQIFLFRLRKRTDYTGVSGSQVILFQYLVRIPVTFICR